MALVKATLEDARENVDKFHSECFKKATSLAEKLKVAIKKPRTCSRQTTRDNVPAESPSDYYKKSITIPFLDHLIAEMNTRFSCLQERASSGIKLIPSLMSSRPRSEDFEWFKDDVNVDSLDVELHQWFLFWKGKNDIPANIIDAAVACDSNFSQMLKLF